MEGYVLPKKDGWVKMNIEKVDNKEKQVQECTQFVGIRFKEAREMRRAIRHRNMERACKPVVLTFENGNKIFCFMSEVELNKMMTIHEYEKNYKEMHGED